MVRHLFSILTTQLLPHVIVFSFGLILFFSLHDALATSELNYQVYSEPTSAVHVVTIPAASNYTITTEITANLTPIADFATRSNAVAAINGGYFDPNNEKTTSYITQEANLVADPRINERLIDNPDLEPYLGKILNRTEFRRYRCEDTRYDITLHTAEIPDGCILQDALGAGPQLLPVDTSVAEGFTAYEDGKLIRDAIGRDALNARSAIAITERGDVILAMVQQQDSTDSGISLADLATFLHSLGATKAMNLDGGSSSSLYYRGQAYYGKLDSEGNEVQRPLKSVLLVRSQSNN
jgi:hypothetical protein